MTGQPTKEDIMAAIEESGYLMEQQIARRLEKLDFFVTTNAAYEDIDEGKSREIDAVAVQRVAKNDEFKLSAFVELIVECKNNNNPTVFVARPKHQHDFGRAPREFLFPVQYETHGPKSPNGSYPVRYFSGFTHLGFDNIYFTDGIPYKAVQFCRIDRKGSKWHANHGGLYDATFYPMAKALDARQKRVPKPRIEAEQSYFWFFFPIVVTSGDIYVVDSAADKPEPQKVDHVRFQREMKNKSLDGVFTIDFINEAYLESYVNIHVENLRQRMREVVNNQGALVRTKNIPWPG